MKTNVFVLTLIHTTFNIILIISELQKSHLQSRQDFALVMGEYVLYKKCSGLNISHCVNGLNRESNRELSNNCVFHCTIGLSSLEKANI